MQQLIFYTHFFGINQHFIHEWSLDYSYEFLLYAKRYKYVVHTIICANEGIITSASDTSGSEERHCGDERLIPELVIENQIELRTTKGANLKSHDFAPAVGHRDPR